jgi:hypothetical protein
MATIPRYWVLLGDGQFAPQSPLPRNEHILRMGQILPIADNVPIRVFTEWRIRHRKVPASMKTIKQPSLRHFVLIRPYFSRRSRISCPTCYRTDGDPRPGSE